MDTLLLTFSVIGFLAVVLLIEGGYMLWQSTQGAEARRIQQRLKTLSAGGRISEETELLKERLLAEATGLERLLLQLPRAKVIDRILLQSGKKTTAGSLAVMTLVAAIAGLILWMVMPLPWWTLPVFVGVAASLPFLNIVRCRAARLKAIEEQLPDTLELMSRAMRAGHAFLSALQMAGTEAPEPIAGEFRSTAEEVNYGVAMQDALMNLAIRVPITDLRFFVIAVAIQRETGGNLAELLDNLASLIRARFKLRGMIRVLSAEGRLSGWILSILPFALLGIIYMINSKFMSLLWTDPAGLNVMYLGGALMVAGIFWMWRIVDIRV